MCIKGEEGLRNWDYSGNEVPNLIRASRSEPHTSELAGGMSVIMYVCLYRVYVTLLL